MLLTVGTALVLVLVTAVAVLHDLARPWLKQRIVSRVEADTGLQVDYQQAQVSVLSGLRLEGLVVRTPPPFQGFAPELLRVGTLEAQWSPRSLLNGPIRVERVAARDMAVTLVADEAGPTSLSGLQEAQPPEPPLGLSQQAAAFLASPPAAGKIELSGVSLSHLRVRNGEVVDRWSLSGLAGTVEARHQDGGWKLFAQMGQAGTPLPLALSREGSAIAPAVAQLELVFSGEVGASAASARVDLDVSRQTFDPRFTVRTLLHGAVSAKFDAGKQLTTLELDRTRLTDSAEVQGRLVLPDSAELPPVMTRALVEVDLARLLQWLPADLRPFSLERGTVRLDAQELTLSAMPQLGAQGKVGLDLDVAALQLVQDELRVALGGGRLSLVAAPDPQQGLAAQLTFSLQGLDAGGPITLRIPKASGELKGQQLRPDLSSPLQVAGEAALSGMVEALDVHASGIQATAERLGFHFQAPLAGEPPFALKADMPVGALRVVMADGREVLNGPVHGKLDVSEVFPRADEPRLGRARARLKLDVGAMHASLDVRKGATDVAYTLAFETPDLVAVRPFLSEPVAARLPWKQLGVSLASTGTVAALFSSSPRLEHRTELRLQRAGWDDVSATTIAAVMRSKGDPWRHQGDLDLRVEGLRVGEADVGAQHQTLVLEFDRLKPSLRLGLTSHAGVKLALDADLAYDRVARSLRCDAKGGFPPIGASPLLAKAQLPPGLDYSRLGLNFELHGTLLGAITDIARDGTLLLAADPLRAASFEGKATVDAVGIRWRKDDQSINVPALRWQLESHAEGAGRNVHSTLTAERLTLRNNDRRLAFSDVFSDTTAAFTEKAEAGELELKHLMKARSVEHQPALPYPVQDLEWSFTALRKPHGVIHIPDMRLSNARTSTQLKVRGQVDLSASRRRLALRGELEQDLSKLTQPGLVESSGNVTVEFQVASPDLVVFRTVSSFLLQNVNVRLPASGIEVQALDGNVPVTENVELTQDGVRLLSGTDVNPYPMLRFADQHPLLSRSSFVSVGSITTPHISISPLAGNLSINQNVFSMSQLEMGVRGGRITGQCMLDWQGKHSTLKAHVRATGVQSSRGEPFDGNAALIVSGKDRSITGRGEILRIGNRHLLDLLDLQDPQHADPATNRTRYALSLGYPKNVQVRFNHGFGRVNISMGGPASLLSLDEIRGIPMGPIVDRVISSMSLPEATP